METVQFICERCGKRMAVVATDLGKQVECPNCFATIQAPFTPPPAAMEAPLPEFNIPTVAEQESIFSLAEESADDLFGTPPAGPKLELPALPSAPRLDIEPLHGPTEASDDDAPLPDPLRGPLPESPEASPPSVLALTPEPPPAAPAPPVAAEPEPATDMPAPPPRRPQGRGLLVPLLLIFLIPYSLVATAAIALLIHQQRNVAPPFDPLERLPDPKGAPGGPRRVKDDARVKHDSPLPDRLKTALKEPLQVGDLLVTPLAVERTPLGELLLDLKLKNLSADTAFDPLPDQFLRYAPRGLDDLKPYTYVALGPDAGQRIYGAYLEYVSTPAHKGPRFDGVLRPGQEELVRLRTDRKYKRLVDRLDGRQGEILWRVQVRRGLVQVKGKDVSATAVVGVRVAPGAVRQVPAEDAARRADEAVYPTATLENPRFSNARGKVACFASPPVYNEGSGQ